MTGLLTSVLHERADAAPGPDLDLDAIIRDGDRRVRRHRVTTGLVAASVAGVLAAGTLAVTGLTGGQDDLVADSPDSPGFADREPAYALGSTVHLGARTFDVGEPVASLVQTDDGVVYTTRNGDVRLYDGATSDVVGRAEGNRLRADDSGSLVSWVELAEDGHPQYVVLDTALEEEVARVDDQAAGASLEPHDWGSQVFAVDDGSVYWRHGPDLVRYDVQAGRESVVHTSTPMADPPTKGGPVVGQIVDVAHGTVAYTVEGGQDRWGIAVGQRPDPDGTVLTEPDSARGVLSPDARLLAVEQFDTMALYTTDDGADVTPTIEGYAYVVAYGWTGHDTAAVIALRDYTDTRATGDVLSCDVSDDACTVVSSFDDVRASSLVLAGGDPVT